MVSSASILLNFECGSRLWPYVKSPYPEVERKALLRLLQGAGYETAVLTNQSDEYGCPTLRYESLEKLERLLRECSVFVGIESFPARYAVYLMRRPTMGLLFTEDPIEWIPAEEVFWKVREVLKSG
jgi:hypothetical protein